MRPILVLFENLRYASYWFIDLLKGQEIKKHTKDISFILENFSSAKSIEKRKKSLVSLIEHAKQTTNFYNKYNGFETFPVINKNLIRDQLTNFQSEIFKAKKNKAVSTSGSTSVALKLYQNQNKVNRNTADSIYFGKLAGFKIGYKLLYLRHWDDNLSRPPFVKFMQNVDELEVTKLNDAYIDSVIENITKDSSTKGWIGYPSGYELICKYLDKTQSKPFHSNVKSIIAMSENLNSYTKKTMQKYFGVPAVSRYSTMETGIVAQQQINCNHYIVNWASYYVEIFKIDEDKPAEKHELGRIVVTDLYNYAIPVIRYDTGDLGIIDYTVTPPVLKHVEGRKSDVIYNTKGEIISSFIITNVVEYKGIKQGQLIQEQQKEYVLKLNSTDEFNEKAKLLKQFKGFLGNDANIKIEYVNEIPRLSSGKQKATINNFIKNT
ncbi:CoF synthetase [Sabulilitoribacter arenilitoris]|uniref:CoF synthetase n=1 Tax=Wocania arenilitoris TaxID=2044858 RepID=A0AAE3JPW3_9FLAO|nr:CoF synthetase [Wocania arenilitoris]MCF7568630.1 CoF synthetase [Wocania arenilitoris]